MTKAGVGGTKVKSGTDAPLAIDDREEADFFPGEECKRGRSRVDKLLPSGGVRGFDDVSPTLMVLVDGEVVRGEDGTLG